MSSSQLFAAAHAAYEAAVAQSRCEVAGAEARVARLKHAAELERLGRYEEARGILDAVNAEREALS